MAQRKRIGPITLGSVDRNHLSLPFCPPPVCDCVAIGFIIVQEGGPTVGAQTTINKLPPAEMDFLSLPATVVCTVLSNLDFIRDIVRLDSAYCHHHYRTIWLELLGSKGFTMSCPVNLSNEDELSWILSKDVRCSSVEFVDDMGAFNEVSDFLRLRGSYIRTVHFHGVNKQQEMLFVALNCQNLTELHASHLDLTCAYREILLRNPNIQTIRCSRFKCSEPGIFAGVSLPKLQTMEIFSSECERGFPWHISTHSNSLRTLTLFECNFVLSDLKAMQNHGPGPESFSTDGASYGSSKAFGAGLENMSMFFNQLIDDEHLLAMLQCLSSLRVLNIQRCALLTDLSLKHIAERVGDRLEVLYVDIKHPESAETEAYLEIFSQKCTNLKYLSINCKDKQLCAGKGTSALVCGCPALRTLVVNKASTISASSRVLAAKLRPELTILTISFDMPSFFD